MDYTASKKQLVIESKHGGLPVVRNSKNQLFSAVRYAQEIRLGAGATQERRQMWWSVNPTPTTPAEDARQRDKWRC